MEYNSKYAAGSYPINNPTELVEAIEDLFGKGSYCLYYKSGKTINHADYGKHPTWFKAQYSIIKKYHYETFQFP